MREPNAVNVAACEIFCPGECDRSRVYIAALPFDSSALIDSKTHASNVEASDLCARSLNSSDAQVVGLDVRHVRARDNRDVVCAEAINARARRCDCARLNV